MGKELSLLKAVQQVPSARGKEHLTFANQTKYRLVEYCGLLLALKDMASFYVPIFELKTTDEYRHLMAVQIYNLSRCCFSCLQLACSDACSDALCPSSNSVSAAVKLSTSVTAVRLVSRF